MFNYGHYVLGNFLEHFGYFFQYLVNLVVSHVTSFNQS